jgi:MFS family permease
MIKDLNCTTEQASTALRSVKVLICYKITIRHVFSVYPLGFGVVPLFTAAFSEEFGRRPLFMVSGVIFALMHLMTALCDNMSVS